MGLGGRLRSLKSNAEIRNTIVRLENERQTFYEQRIQAGVERKYENYFDLLEKELPKMEEVASYTKVLLVRFLESLQLVESNLNGRKKASERKSGEDSAKQELRIVNNYLNRIGKLKTRMREEATRSILDERKILGNIR